MMSSENNLVRLINMRKMMLFGKKYGGQDPQLIEEDNFRMIISVPEFSEPPSVDITVIQSGAESKAESKAESESIKIVKSLKEKILAKSEIAEILGENTVSGALNRLIKTLISEGLIEYTIPDKPNSRLQKYRLTDKGRLLLKG